MFGPKLLERSAAIYGSCTAFAAIWVTLALPIRQDRVGGNYQKVLRVCRPLNKHAFIMSNTDLLSSQAARRVPWKRLPKAI